MSDQPDRVGGEHDGERDLYAALIGPDNAGYYLAYLDRAAERGYAPLSWHWPAFFLGLFWLLYRKQYQWAFIAFFYPYLAALLSTAPALLGVDGLAWPTFAVLMIAFRLGYLPLNANGIYYRWARGRVATVRQRLGNQPAQGIEQLRAWGGTHRVAPWAVGVALMALSMMTMLAPTT